MGKYCTYIRVSTTKQSAQGLGMDAQRDMCERFVSSRGGQIFREFSDVESGKSRTRKGLWAAIDFCKVNNMPLVVARLDRLARDIEFTFKVLNTGIEIHFTDMPSVNTMILGVFASVAQYERELNSTRTRQALTAKKERGEQTGGTKELWGSKSGKDDNYRADVIKKASDCAAKKRREESKNNPNNRAFWEFLEDWQEAHGKITANTDWTPIVAKLVERGKKTTTGLEFTKARARALYYSLKRVYNN